jgi:hypothetical protein
LSGMRYLSARGLLKAGGLIGWKMGGFGAWEVGQGFFLVRSEESGGSRMSLF